MTIIQAGSGQLRRDGVGVRLWYGYEYNNPMVACKVTAGDRQRSVKDLKALGLLRL